jgi:hypothetical protein
VRLREKAAWPRLQFSHVRNALAVFDRANDTR